MAQKISFGQFDAAVKTGQMPAEQLGDYVCFDDESPVPKLVFRKDALTDAPPDGYDVDLEIYHYLREQKKRERSQIAAFAFISKTAVVAEGDSWFNLPYLPPLFTRRAIADWIDKHKQFRMNNIAYWGDTLQGIVTRREFIEVLDEEQPTIFMFTAGGNDLQKALAAGKLLHNFDPSIPIEQHISPEGEKLFKYILDTTRDIFAEVSHRYPKIKIYCHGYDYPRPQAGDGKYIGKPLKKQNFTDAAAQSIVRVIIDRLNASISNAAQANQNATYIDCRNQTTNFTWHDDMHPSNTGFEALAHLFETTMSAVAR